MKDELHESMKKATYCLWEHTNNQNALKLWYCAEEIAHYFQKNGILNRDTIDDIFMLGKDNSRYVDFVRNISYRIYDYTESENTYRNWFMAENLIKNNEWCNAILNIANIFANIYGDPSLIDAIKNENVRNYYRDKIQGDI